MSLLKVESFGHLTAAQLALKHTTVSITGSASIIAGANPRSGGYGLSVTGAMSMLDSVGVQAALTVGFRTKISGTIKVEFLNSSAHMGHALLSKGSIYFEDSEAFNDTTTFVSDIDDDFHHVQIVLVPGAAGSITLRLDGVNLASMSGNCTTGVATEPNEVGITFADGTSCYFCDYFIGTTNYDSLCIDSFVPSSDVDTDGTVSVGTNHYDVLDDGTPNLSTYVAMTASMKETFGFVAEPSAATIVGIAVNPLVENAYVTPADAPSTFVRQLSGTTYHNLGEITLPEATQEYRQVIAETNPATLVAYSLADIAAITLGLETTT